MIKDDSFWEKVRYVRTTWARPSPTKHLIINMDSVNGHQIIVLFVSLDLYFHIEI